MQTLSEYMGMVGTQLLAALPNLLCLVAGFVVLLVRRPRAPRAATLALWCVAGMAVLTLLWLFVFPVIVLSQQGVAQTGITLSLLGVIRSIIEGLLLVGLVLAVTLDRPAPRPATWPGQYPPGGQYPPADQQPGSAGP